MMNDIYIQIHTNDRLGNVAQQIRAVSLSARNVENVLAMHEIPGERIPMQVFGGNLSFNLGQIPFACPLQDVKSSVSLRHLFIVQ